MKFKEFTISEGTNLSKTELDKPNAKTKEKRTDILRRLIKDSKPLELAKGGTIVVGDIEDAMSKIDAFEKMPQNFNLLDTDGNAFPITKLKKSKVFGGGFGGAGSGTKDTARNESHNAVMIQAMLEHGIHDVEYFDNDIMTNAYKKAKVDVELKKILDMPDEWILSSYNIAKLLVKSGYVNKSHIIHRGSNEMKKIYAIKNFVYKKMKMTPLKDDKWNPGDIWAISKRFDFKNIDVTSVNAMNKSLIQGFNDRTLVGISLKGPETKYPPPLKEFNNEYPPDTDMHKYMGSMLSSKGGTYWSAKNAAIKFDGGELMLKDNSPGATIKAEIKGKKARGGGLSWGVMIDFMKRESTRAFMPEHAKGIVPMAKKIEKKNEKEIKKYFKYYNHFYNNVSYDEFLSELAKKDWKWISAKLASTILCYNIEQLPGMKANSFITNIVNYAGSKLSESSVYVKAGK